MLPYRPQSLDVLRRRLPLALEKPYGVRERVSPWKDPCHVFDFESGLRLVVTKKVIDIGCDPCLHVAANLIPHTMAWDYRRTIVKYRDRNPEEWIKRLVIGQFQELDPVPLQFLGFSNDGVPHFFAEIGYTVCYEVA